MANEEHLGILRQGVEAWNAWRRENTGIRPDLQGADLRRAKLDDADLRGADLLDANLRDANLQGANLLGANLLGANLQGADLQDADLQDADLQDADLQDANLEGANLRRADLQGANLLGAELRRANLLGAKLQGADLQDANLQGADLQDANLQGADLQDANLEGANLRRAELRGADLRRADLRGARLVPSLPLRYVKLSWQELLRDTIGNAATELPKGIQRPDWWDTEEEEDPNPRPEPRDLTQAEQMSGLPRASTGPDDRLQLSGPEKREDVPESERTSLFKVVRTQAEKLGKRWVKSNAVSHDDEGDADDLLNAIGEDPANFDAIYVNGLLETMAAILPPDLEDADHRLGALLTALRASLLRLSQTYADYRAYEQRVTDEAAAPPLADDDANEFAGVADDESMEEALEPASLARLQRFRDLFVRTRRLSSEVYARAKLLYLGAIRNLWAAATTRLWQVQDELGEAAEPIWEWIDQETGEIIANASQEVKDAYKRFKSSPLSKLWNLTKKLKPLLAPIAIFLGLSSG
ncbi:MAG: pentapeptide repeat-containing protein [Pseudomonadota bacterium]